MALVRGMAVFFIILGQGTLYLLAAGIILVLWGFHRAGDIRGK